MPQAVAVKQILGNAETPRAISAAKTIDKCGHRFNDLEAHTHK